MNDTSTGGSGEIRTTTEPRRTGLRVTALITLIALALGIGGGWLIAALTDDDATGDVWVVQAQTARATASEIVLEGVAPSVIGIADDGAGGRESSYVDISRLTQDWEDVFGDAEPRAVLSGVSGDRSQAVIVELGRPDPGAGSITFPITPVGGSAILELEVERATLVIDGSGLLEPHGVDA